MRKMSHIQAAEGTEMSHPGPPSRRIGGPSCWSALSGQPCKDCLGCRVTWPKVMLTQGHRHSTTV